MIQKKISIKQYNTFDINIVARFFADFKTIDELSELLEFEKRTTNNDQRLSSVAAATSFSPKILKDWF